MWLQTVSICMTGGLPCELLCLLLKERKLQISREGEIYFSYDVDLADLPQDASEKECVSLCAETLLALMRKKLFLAAILLAVVVIAAAAVLFISQAMTGEMPFSFLSWGSLQQIGTEFMSQ